MDRHDHHDDVTGYPASDEDDDCCQRCGEPYANDLTGLCMDCEVGPPRT